MFPEAKRGCYEVQYYKKINAKPVDTYFNHKTFYRK